MSVSCFRPSFRIRKSIELDWINAFQILTPVLERPLELGEGVCVGRVHFQLSPYIGQRQPLVGVPCQSSIEERILLVKMLENHQGSGILQFDWLHLQMSAPCPSLTLLMARSCGACGLPSQCYLSSSHIIGLAISKHCRAQ